MITYVKGNLFESPAHVLVNTVNTEGVMGKGIAKKFKSLYPEMFREYQRLCEQRKFAIGKLWIYKTKNKWVLNFPTKITWRKPSKIKYIESGLQAFVKRYAERGITSIAFPPLGCGNGELNWENQVQPLMGKYLGNLPINIYIYPHYRNDQIQVEHRSVKEMKKWLRAEPQALGFAEVWEDLKKVISKEINLYSKMDKNKFSVKLVDVPEDGIEIVIDNNNNFIAKENLQELWDQIRTYGYAMRRIIPGSLEIYADELISLFSELPYCQTVTVNTNYVELSEGENIGLQLVPNMNEAIPTELFQQSPYGLKRA